VKVTDVTADVVAPWRALAYSVWLPFASTPRSALQVPLASSRSAVVGALKELLSSETSTQRSVGWSPAPVGSEPRSGNVAGRRR
jgi:hypothetical protein